MPGRRGTRDVLSCPVANLAPEHGDVSFRAATGPRSCWSPRLPLTLLADDGLAFCSLRPMKPLFRQADLLFNSSMLTGILIRSETMCAKVSLRRFGTSDFCFIEKRPLSGRTRPGVVRKDYTNRSPTGSSREERYRPGRGSRVRSPFHPFDNRLTIHCLEGPPPESPRSSGARPRRQCYQSGFARANFWCRGSRQTLALVAAVILTY